MDTTQDPKLSPDDAADAALEALEEAESAAAPEIAERLADTLTAALDEGETRSDGDDGREPH